MKRFIVLEGLDGAGKSTQIRLLKNFLTERRINYKYLHFPRTDSPIYGEMIANFLRGDYGDVNTVNPYLVALLYAGDRDNAKKEICDWLEKGYFLVVDRYVYSNMAFQGAKFKKPGEKRKLKQWIDYLEFGYNKIPRPTLSIFLHMNFDFVSKKLKDARQGMDRNYLNGKEDIHERSLELQKNVEVEYMKLIDEEEDFYSINCFNEKGETLSPGKIFEKIIDLLIEKAVLKKF